MREAFPQPGPVCHEPTNESVIAVRCFFSAIWRSAEASNSRQKALLFRETSMPREPTELILQFQSVSSSKSRGQILQTSANARGPLMPERHPDILDHACVLFLLCLFCADCSVRRPSGLIFPSIRQSETEAATSAQQRRFRHGFFSDSLSEVPYRFEVGAVSRGCLFAPPVGRF